MIKYLKKIPIAENYRFKAIQDDYKERRDYYQQCVIATLAFDKNNSLYDEKLVDCQEKNLMCRNYYFFSSLLDDFPEVKKHLSEKVMLRESVVKDLMLIDEKIKSFGLRLLILSGYRHPDLQSAILKAARRDKGDDFAKKMLANPNYHTPHATGAVFDIEIWSEKENIILPTKSEKGFGRYVLEGLKNLSSKEIIIRENRRLIHNLLSTDYILRKDKLFIPHPFEYWHYGRNEKLSKFFNQDNDYPVFYDVIQ